MESLEHEKKRIQEYWDEQNVIFEAIKQAGGMSKYTKVLEKKELLL